MVRSLFLLLVIAASINPIPVYARCRCLTDIKPYMLKAVIPPKKKQESPLVIEEPQEDHERNACEVCSGSTYEEEQKGQQGDACGDDLVFGDDQVIDDVEAVQEENPRFIKRWVTKIKNYVPEQPTKKQWLGATTAGMATVGVAALLSRFGKRNGMRDIHDALQGVDAQLNDLDTRVGAANNNANRAAHELTRLQQVQSQSPSSSGSSMQEGESSSVLSMSSTGRRRSDGHVLRSLRRVHRRLSGLDKRFSGFDEDRENGDIGAVIGGHFEQLAGKISYLHQQREALNDEVRVHGEGSSSSPDDATGVELSQQLENLNGAVGEVAAKVDKVLNARVSADLSEQQKGQVKRWLQQLREFIKSDVEEVMKGSRGVVEAHPGASNEQLREQEAGPGESNQDTVELYERLDLLAQTQGEQLRVADQRHQEIVNKLHELQSRNSGHDGINEQRLREEIVGLQQSLDNLSEQKSELEKLLGQVRAELNERRSNLDGVNKAKNELTEKNRVLESTVQEQQSIMQELGTRLERLTQQLDEQERRKAEEAHKRHQEEQEQERRRKEEERVWAAEEEERRQEQAKLEREKLEAVERAQREAEDRLRQEQEERDRREREAAEQKRLEHERKEAEARKAEEDRLRQEQEETERLAQERAAEEERQRQEERKRRAREDAEKKRREREVTAKLAQEQRRQGQARSLARIDEKQFGRNIPTPIQNLNKLIDLVEYCFNQYKYVRRDITGILDQIEQAAQEIASSSAGTRETMNMLRGVFTTNKRLITELEKNGNRTNKRLGDAQRLINFLKRFNIKETNEQRVDGLISAFKR